MSDRAEARRAAVNALIQTKYSGRLADFARAIERTDAAVWQIANGGRNIGEKLARHIEEKVGLRSGALDVPGLVATSGTVALMNRLMDNTSGGPDMKGKVPLISWVQAGDFAGIVDNFSAGHADEWIETTVPIHRHTFALRVKGESMKNPTGEEPTFPPGVTVVVEPDLIGSPAEMQNRFLIIRAYANEEVTFKQLVREGGKYWCKPLNPQFPMFELPEDAAFVGVVREKISRYL